MKLKLLPIVLLSLFTLGLKGQSLFTVKYKMRLNSQVWGVANSKVDSSYIFIGGSAFRDSLNTDKACTIILKTDYTGSYKIMKYFQFSNTYLNPIASIITADAKGREFIVAGRISGLDTITFQNQNIPFIAKLSDSLSLNTVKKLTLSNSDNISSIVNTPDGGFVVVGSTNFSSNSSVTDSSKMFVIKLDSLLNQQWSKLFGDTSSSEGWGVFSLPDSGLILSGLTYQFNTDPNNFPARSNCFILRLDKFGNKIWCKRSLGNLENMYRGNASFALTIDSCIAICYTGLGAGVANSQTSFAKIDFNGNLIWHRFQSTACNYIAALKDSGFMKLSDQSSYIDKFGNIQSRTYQNFPFQYNYNSIIHTSDNGFVIAGTELIPAQNMRNILIVKKDSSSFTSCYNNTATSNIFSIISPVTFTDWNIPDSNTVVNEGILQIVINDTLPNMQLICSNNTAITTDDSDFDIKIFPNPFLDQLTVISKDNIDSVELYDCTGRLILKRKISERIGMLKYLDSLKKGLYILTVTTESRVNAYKIIK